MALPKKLKNMNLFNEGNSYMGMVASVTLPKLERKKENWRGGGMNAAVPVDFGMSDDAMEMEWTIGGIDLNVIRQFGISNVAGVGLRFAGAYQRDDTGEISSVEVIVRGSHSGIDFGESKVGDDTEHTITTALSYYKLVVDGRTEIEIDAVNMIENVNGVDRLAEQRKAIGL